MARLTLKTLTDRSFELDCQDVFGERVWIATRKDLRDLFNSVHDNEVLATDVAGLINGLHDDFCEFRFIIKD